ncbi:MAG: 4Fe-4S dicluster domain-containing protein [Chloroflexi bacterium]|nr:4Fe-4S dicluster domain-containing protein [Chloroflexota bacterium]
MRRVFAREEVCIACRLCEVACAVEHSESKHIITAMRHEHPKPISRIHVEVDGPFSFAMQCRHCEEPLCAQSCLTQALRKGEDGVVRYNPDYCIACYTCMLACPEGAIVKASRGTWKGVAKCDLCPDREIPACVAICPNEALLFGEAWEWEAMQTPAEPPILARGGHRA